MKRAFKIYKYPIPFHKETIHQLPQFWTALDWQLQDGIPTLWAKVQEDQLYMESICFAWLPTGAEVPANYTYMATFQEPPYVWHLFIKNR